MTWQREKTELDSTSRSGRPANPENTTRVRELIEYEPYISQKIITSRFGIHHETVKRILKHELGLVKGNFK
jgi:DNA invertase Pin-like site-specific DNA recombinase